MNIANYKEYCFADYSSTDEEIDGLKLGDVVIIDYDHQGQYNPKIGIIIQIRILDDVNDEYIRIDSCGMCSSKSLRLATDEEIQKYRPNILEENWNKEKAKEWKTTNDRIMAILGKKKKQSDNSSRII